VQADSLVSKTIIFLQATIYRLIPLDPLPSSDAIIPMDWSPTVLIIEAPQYMEVSIQANLAYQITRAYVQELVWEEVQQNLLTWLEVQLYQIKSTQGAVAGALELMLINGLNQNQEMHEAFLPTLIQGDVTPDSVEGDKEANDDETSSLQILNS